MPGTLSPFNNKTFKTRPQLLKTATISDFSGGLNAVDNDVTMKTKYAKVLTNWQQDIDGSHAVRYGNELKWDVTGVVTGTIIETVYFNDHIIVFTTTGQIAKITEAGVKTKIWDSAIAAALPGAPTGWSNPLIVGCIDSTEFKGNLVVVNGTDKPLLIDKTSMTANYLQDLATGSNVNTPIGRFCTTVANYVVIAGIAAEPGSIWISSSGTSGVFVGDTAPNDGIVYSLDSFVPQNSETIIGLGSFRNYLLAFFEGAIVVVKLGVYDNATTPNHTPEVENNIISHGVINHRTTITTKNDFIMADVLGVHSAQQNQFGLIMTSDVSELIEPLYLPDMQFAAAQRPKAFSVHNQIEHRMMTFVTTPVETVVWVLSFKDGVKDYRWTKFSNMIFDCGCTSKRGRVFLAKGTKIFQYGNGVFPGEAYHADRLGDTDGTWTTATAYTIGQLRTNAGISYKVLINHTSGVFADDLNDKLIGPYLGEAISFDWELPWTDLNERARKKKLSYIQADTQGTATFTIESYVDNFRTHIITGADTPSATMEFVAGDSSGYGANGSQPYGGGRRLRDERPWGMPSEFKILKLRVYGSTRDPLRIITLTIFTLQGSYRR